MAEKTFQQKAQSWINPKLKTKQEKMDVVGNVDQGQATIPKPFLSLGTRGNYIRKLWRNGRRKRARNVGGNQVDGSTKPTGAIASQVQGSWERVQAWLDKQSMPVEAAVVTATGAVQGAAIGALMGNLTKDVSSSFPTPPQASLNHQAMASLKQAQVVFLFYFGSTFISYLQSWYFKEL